MNRKESCLKRIEENLSHIRVKVEMRNAINLYDVNIIAEDFYADFLNVIYDSHSFSNLNTVAKNATAIDLVDKVNRKCIQITSDNSSTKIHETLKKFEDNNLHKEYDSLKVLMLVKKKSYSTDFSKNNGSFSFSNSDVIDATDLFEQIRELSTDKIEEIANFLDKEVMYKLKDTSTLNSNEMDTIISIIEYLSDPTNLELEVKDPDNVDPEHKIYKRFAEHSEFLISIYTVLHPIYISELNAADDAIQIDAVSIRKRQAYLKLKSDELLNDCENNPKKAFNLLVLDIESAIQKTNNNYDYGAIRFFLINELIKCNVFPNKTPSVI